MLLADVNSNLLQLFYDNGFRLFPSYLGADGKLHAPFKWPERAAKNDVELQALVAEAASKGEVQRLGVVPPEHWMIVDIDVRDGKPGLQNYAALLSTHKISATPAIQVKSRSGGLHLYFKCVSKRVKTVSNVAQYEGVDIRGQGGFVYAPFRAGDLDTWTQGEYLLFDIIDDFKTAIPFDDRKLFLEHTVADEKKYLAEDIRTRARGLARLPKGGRDESLHFAIHEMYRAGYTEPDAHAYLDWLIDICDQDDDIAALRAKFHGLVTKIFEDEKKLVIGSVVELDVVIRSLRGAEIFALRAEQKNSIGYMAMQENVFKMTPFQPYGREVFSDILNMYSVADIDGKIKPASRAIMSRSAALLPSADRRGFVPRSDVVLYREPETGAECINTYRAPMTKQKALELSPQANGAVWAVFTNFLEHLFGDKAQMALEMIAWMVHKPDRKMITAPILISEVQGVGKDTLINILTLLIGRQYMQRVDQASQLIDSKINISRALLLYIKELQLGKGIGARNEVEKLGSRLKSLITETVQRCEEKFMQPFDAQSFCNVIIASNRTTVAQLIESTDRRYNIFDCLPEKSLDHFPQFDLMADLSRQGTPADIAALWLRLSEVKVGFQFDRETAPNDAHKARLLSREYEAIDQFLLENLPDGFTQHLAAYMISKSGLCPPQEAFTRAEYFIRNMLKRHIEVIKVTGSGGSSSWQFSRCKSYMTDNVGATWAKGHFRPTRPYVYINRASPNYVNLVNSANLDFWAGVEQIYEKVLAGGSTASLTGDLSISKESLNMGLSTYLFTKRLDMALAAVQNDAKGSGVH